jgi:cytochrome c peroxidase
VKVTTAQEREVARGELGSISLSPDGRSIVAQKVDSTAKAISIFGRVGRRSAPALINRGYGRAFLWDARVSSLEEQVLKPIEDPNEMDLPVGEAARRVGLSPDHLSRALSSFVRSILLGDAPFDRFVNGDRSALSNEQQAGLQIFRGRGNCTACHVGPTFSDERTHNTGIAWAGRPGGAGGAGGEFLDEGRAAITGKPDDGGAFKTPTLREVTRTAPYMHDGSLPTLEAVVDYYDRGGNVNPILDPDIRPLRLSLRRQTSTHQLPVLALGRDAPLTTA